MSQTPEEAADDQDAGPASQPTGADQDTDPDADQDAGPASQPDEQPPLD